MLVIFSDGIMAERTQENTHTYSKTAARPLASKPYLARKSRRRRGEGQKANQVPPAVSDIGS